MLAIQPAAAQSILRDAETEALLADMSRDLILAAGLLPSNVNVVVINDRSINAFVAGTQDVYIHSGLIEAADNANEVQGVIAHELGHIALGHSITRSENASKAGNITILSLLLGLAACTPPPAAEEPIRAVKLLTVQAGAGAGASDGAG
ncbi:MAG: M48 family metalloprotease, partial [Parvibaculum sp.]